MMADYLELVKRLRGVNWVCRTYGKTEVLHDTVCHEAADALEAQAKRIEELKEALKPFAYYAEQIPDDVSDMASASGTVGDLRQARKALGEDSA
jgi:hypothetical protein